MEFGLVLRFAAVLGLVGANAFFVAAEFALVGARRTRINQLAQEGDRLARIVQRAQSDLDRSISGTQLGITLSSLGLGWIGEPALASSLENLLAFLGVQASEVALHSAAVAIAFLIITYLHIVLGELAPKTVALLRPESVSRYVAGPLLTFNRLMRPGIWILNGSARRFLDLFRVPRAGAHGEDRVHSPEEIEMLVNLGTREGVVEEDEQAMISNVFDLTRTAVREVMTPRPDIIAVAADDGISEILRAAAESGRSRVPVTGESLDDIVGVVVVKDLIPHVLEGREVEEKHSSPFSTAGDVMREAFFVPGAKPVDDLLAEMRRAKTHMAVIVDEFGGTAGLVTLEDLLEEIVGEIYDEHDEEEEGIRWSDDGSASIEGGFPFSDLAEALDLESEGNGAYDTAAGYVIGALKRIPEPGDRVPLGGAELEVLEVVDQRITRLALHGVPANRREILSQQDGGGAE